MKNKKRKAELHNQKYQRNKEHLLALEFMQAEGLKSRQWHLNQEYRLANEIMEAEGLEPRIKVRPRGGLSVPAIAMAALLMGVYR